MEKALKYGKVICVKREGDPRPRMTRDGYTKRAGSPTGMKVQLDGESLWRRVYVWQFSNTRTLFVRVKGECLIVRVD